MHRARTPSCRFTRKTACSCPLIASRRLVQRPSEKAYDAVFKAITLNVKFTIAEIVELGPGWAFARTNSAGTTTDHATGAKRAEGNQELFVLKKDDDGSWKIARYSFSPTNPPRH
jgi:ketosteroid isomerase-like protein